MKDTNDTSRAKEISAKSENHREAGNHLVSAAAHHFKAANYINVGDLEKTGEHIVLAEKYFDLACKARSKIV